MFKFAVLTVVVAPLTLKSPATVRSSPIVTTDVPAPIATADSPDKSTAKAEPLPPDKPAPATDVFKFDSSITLLATVAAPPAAIATSELTLPNIASSKLENVIDFSVPPSEKTSLSPCAIPVSYTHLTLPTNREV